MDNPNKLQCSVKGKIKCIFQTIVVSAPSKKHKGQKYKVTASENFNNEVKELLDNGSLTASVKFDGTCCLIQEFNGRPWLWARHDVKPNKSADKRFKAYQNSKNEHLLNTPDATYPNFQWNIESDFKEIPDNWMAASGGVELFPDDIGHLVGWVPVDPSLRTHIWHLSTVDLNQGEGLFFIERTDGHMKVTVNKLKDYLGKTFELIGSNINANPYSLGSKKTPIHLLVQHGECGLKDILISRTNGIHEQLKSWFTSHEDGQVEGIVWHGSNGNMFKLHRHHLDLPWPLTNPSISSRPVIVDLDAYEPTNVYQNQLFLKLKEWNGQTFEKLSNMLMLDDKEERT